MAKSQARPWKIFAGLWAAPGMNVPMFYSGFGSQAAAEKRAEELIEQSASAEKKLVRHSPVIVSGPAGVVLWLELDDDRKIVRHKGRPNPAVRIK